MQVITEFLKRDCMAFWGQTFVWKMGKRETITFLYVKNIYTTLKRQRYSEMLINTGYLHVVFCHIHSYNANDIDRYLYLLFLLYPISLCQKVHSDFLYNYCAFYILVALTLTPQKLQIETISDQKRQQLLQNVCCYIRLNEVGHPPILIKKKKFDLLLCYI